jgi:hypothetical protein
LPSTARQSVIFDCSARYARSARIAPLSPPTSSSLADEKRVGSLLLSTAARDPWTRRVVRLAAREAYRLALAVALGVGAALVA